MILAGLCDLLDGPVARLQHRVSLFGAFPRFDLRPLRRPDAFPRPARLLRPRGSLPLRRAHRRSDGRRRDGQLRESARQFARARIGSWLLGSPRTPRPDDHRRASESHVTCSLDSRHRPEYHRHSSHRPHLDANRRSRHRPQTRFHHRSIAPRHWKQTSPTAPNAPLPNFSRAPRDADGSHAQASRHHRRRS